MTAASPISRASWTRGSEFENSRLRPSVTATSGVAFGGAAVAPDGKWAPLALGRVAGTARAHTVVVNPSSAVLASLLPVR